MRIELIEYIINNSIKLAKKSPKKEFILTVHFNNVRHIYESDYKLPKNFTIAFTTKNLKGSIYYDQLVNLRNLRKTGKPNYGFVFNSCSRLLEPAINALEPSKIFITNEIMEKKKFNFSTDFTYGKIVNIAARSQNKHIHILKK
jgi:hypothetical protein